MAGLKVYFDLMFQPARAVVLFLKANSIPFTPQPIVLRKGEHLYEEYKKVNPFHGVPAIDDNGFKLTESVAILKYLSDKYKVADHWYPKDLQKRALVDRYMAWQHLNLRFFGSMVSTNIFMITRIAGKPVDEKQLAVFREQLEARLDKIENIFLHDTKFLCGDDISLGDLLGICELMQPVVVGHKVFNGRPKLGAWASRVKERVHPHFDEVHEILLEAMQVYESKLKL